MGSEAVKILLTLILKDDTEVESIKRMLESFKPFVTSVCAVVTGIDDTTKLKKLLDEYKVTYIAVTPQTHPKIYYKDGGKYIFSNFAEARNVSFELASKLQEKFNYDFWTWADADDVLVNGQELVDCAATAKQHDFDEVFFTYWYSIRITDGAFSDKDVQIDHARERLLKPNMFKWVSRLHEIALPLDDNYKPKITYYDYSKEQNRYCVWAHITEPDRVMAAMDRNIKILELQAKEEQHKDPRTVFYLAKTYYDKAGMGQPELYQMCDLLLDDYLEKSGWAEERANAWEYKGKIRMNTGNHRAAIDCFHNALKQYGNRHMPILYLAKEYFEVGDFEQSEFWLDTALKMDPPQTRTTIGNPLEVKFMAASLKINDCIRKNDIDGAIKWVKTRNEIAGMQDDGMLKGLEDARMLNEAAKWVFNYSKWLKDNGHKDKIPHVIASLPFDLGRESFAHIMANEYNTPKVWGDKEIAIYASFGAEHFEQWSGRSLDRGIGGSETAVIELAKRWVKKGYQVTVYGDPREDEGEIEGVTYKPWYHMNWNDEFNIVIFWRAPYLLDRPIKAKKIFMDLHDVASQLDWTDKRMEKVDKVFFKSKFHRSMLPKLAADKAVIISNGI